MLGTLLQGVLPQAGLGLDQSRGNFFEIIPRVVDLVGKDVVLLLKLFVLISLGGVQVIEPSLVGKLNLLDLLLVLADL